MQPLVGIADTADSTSLGRVAARRMSELNGPSGINLMPPGPDAFVARLTLVNLAERSLDLQYYSWQDDMVGKLLLGAVLRAADRRGPRATAHRRRGCGARRSELLLLDAHPNIEARLLNPISTRSAKALWMISDFRRVDRRMHNKSFTQDNQMTIVGGRNIGDEYSEASTVMNYGDLDALAIGAAVAAVSARFDRYWNSPIVYGIRELRHDSLLRPASSNTRRPGCVRSNNSSATGVTPRRCARAGSRRSCATDAFRSAPRASRSRRTIPSRWSSRGKTVPRT